MPVHFMSSSRTTASLTIRSHGRRLISISITTIENPGDWAFSSSPGGPANIIIGASPAAPASTCASSHLRSCNLENRPMSLQVKIDVAVATRVVVRPIGKLDAVTCQEFDRALDGVLAQAPRGGTLVIDLA